MLLHDLAERFSAQLDDIRDRTAEAVRPDGDSASREVHRLARRIDAVEDDVVERIDRLDTADEARWAAVASAMHRTTWPRRLLWLGLGATAGMAVAHLGDPDRGRSRRKQYADQLASRARSVAGQAANQAKITVDRAKGSLFETVKDARGDDVPADPRVLEQRIKSQVFGHRDDVADVVIRIDAPGEVALKGTVPTRRSEQELLASVGGVDGVIDIHSELAVRSS